MTPPQARRRGRRAVLAGGALLLLAGVLGVGLACAYRPSGEAKNATVAAAAPAAPVLSTAVRQEWKTLDVYAAQPQGELADGSNDAARLARQAEIRSKLSPPSLPVAFAPTVEPGVIAKAKKRDSYRLAAASDSGVSASSGAIASPKTDSVASAGSREMVATMQQLQAAMQQVGLNDKAILHNYKDN